MGEALIVNPYDSGAIAEAVYKAIHMPLEERQARWRTLMDGIQAQDLIWWRERFLNAVPADAEVPVLS
jgi:trehalose 6-phosphate synthase